MYLLKTVCSEDLLDFICKIAKLEEGSQVASIITGLAGKQDEIIDILVMLLTGYSFRYPKIKQQHITKIHVEPKGDIDKNGIGEALAKIDEMLPTIIGMIAGSDSLEALVTGLVTDLDVGNLLMSLIVPLLAGLEEGDTDINTILGYVADFTNIDLDLSPAAFANDKFGSKLKAFIGDADSWSDIAEDYIKYAYTYTVGEGEDAETFEYFGVEGETTYTRLVPQALEDGTYGFDLTGIEGKYVLVVALKGDYNLDGAVTTNDVAQANKAFVNGTEPSALQNYVFDMTGDDEITTNDVAKVNKAIVNETAIEW